MPGHIYIMFIFVLDTIQHFYPALTTPDDFQVTVTEVCFLDVHQLKRAINFREGFIKRFRNSGGVKL